MCCNLDKTASAARFQPVAAFQTCLLFVWERRDRARTNFITGDTL